MALFGLARGSLGAGSLWSMAVGASSPMIVVSGGIVATFAATGVVGLPLAFIVVTLVLVPLTVAFVEASRHIRHAAPAYALLALGLGRVWGTAGASVALLAYNCIQVSIFGLLGAILDGFLGWPWWAWALAAWVFVGAVGIRSVRLGARMLAVLLVCELALLTLFDVLAFVQPVGGSVSWTAWSPDRLIVGGIGGALVLTAAAFVGFEIGPTYAEEARTARSVGRATYAALGFLGLFYAVTAWAMTLTVGPDAVAGAGGVAADPAAAFPAGWMASAVGSWVAPVWTLLLIVGMLVALLSFHSAVARQVYALSRERVLPVWLSRVRRGPAGGAPVGGSLLQSTVALLVIATVVATEAKPLAMFTWLSTIAAVGVITLLVGCSAAALGFFARNPALDALAKDGAAVSTVNIPDRRRPSRSPGQRVRLGRSHAEWWIRTGAPALGFFAGTGALALMVTNVDTLLQLPVGSALRLVPPALVAVAAVIGVWWGLRLRLRRPRVFDGIGRGRPHPMALLDHGVPEV